jgi:hypothetical protein
MKTQILITDHKLERWTKDVNDHLNGGWVVVPGTLQIAKSVSGGIISDFFAVVLEGEVVGDE